jgi:hypothetical protein
VRVCFPAFVRKLQQNHRKLTEILFPEKTGAYMYEKEKLSREDYQRLRATKPSVEATKTLLNIVANMKSQATYDCFLTALQSTQQLEAHKLLTLPGMFYKCYY